MERSPDPWTGSRRWILPLALLLLIDFLLSIVMLMTDKNLQTDFGAKPAYFLHWYGVLVMGILDLIGALVLLALALVTPLPAKTLALRKWVLRGALGWSILAILAMVGVVETYQQVGFTTMSQFSQYLFGTTAYPGALSYIPWLYDLLLVGYVVTAAAGGLAVWMTRHDGAAPA